MGRPTKLTAALQREIISAIEGGMYQEDAVAAAGLGTTAFYEWKRRGDEELRRREEGAEPDPNETKYVKFAEALTPARAKAERKKVLIVDKVAEGGFVLAETTVTRPDGSVERKVTLAAPDAKAAGWWLERSFPKKWGRKDRIEHVGGTGDDGEAQPIHVAVSAKEALLHRLTQSAMRVGDESRARDSEGDEEEARA